MMMRIAALACLLRAACGECASESCPDTPDSRGAGLLQHGTAHGKDTVQEASPLHAGCTNFIKTCLGQHSTEEEELFYNANWTAWKVGFGACCSARYEEDMCGPMDDTLFGFLGGSISGGDLVKDTAEPELKEFCEEADHLLKTHFDHMELQGTSLSLRQLAGASKTLNSLAEHMGGVGAKVRAESGVEAVQRRVGECREDETCWEQVSSLQGFFLELHSSGGATRCFPGGSLVAQASGSFLPVEKLHKGMQLLSPTLSGEGAALVAKDFLADYHMFDDFPDTVELEYVEISHQVSEKTGRPLRMSGHHLLFLLPAGEADWQLVRAADVRVGDTVLALNPADTSATSATQLSQVTGLKKVMAKGAFTPLTTSARLFVEGVAVSSMAISGDQIVRFYESRRPETRLAWAEGLYTVIVGPAMILHSLNLPYEWYLHSRDSVLAVHRSTMNFFGLFW